MTNEISKEITLEDRLKFFEVEVKDYFEYDYKNENGYEDTREACLIRGGYRIALQAKECINHQKAEIEELKTEIERMEDENYTLKNKIEIRDNLIEQLGSDIDIKYNTIYTMREKLKIQNPKQ